MTADAGLTGRPAARTIGIVRGPAVTLHCPRCQREARPHDAAGPLGLVACAGCGLTYTSDDGARTAPVGEITRVRSRPREPRSPALALVEDDTAVTLVVQGHRSQLWLAGLITVMLSALFLVGGVALRDAPPVQLTVLVMSGLILPLLWYSTAAMAFNRTRIRIDERGLVAVDRPLPIARRRTVPIAAAVEAYAARYTRKEVSFHQVMARDVRRQRAVTIAIVDRDEDAREIAAHIRDAARRWHHA